MRTKIFALADEILKKYSMTSWEALDIATKMVSAEQYNEAHLLGLDGVPGSLEKVGMALDSVAASLSDISRSIDHSS